MNQLLKDSKYTQPVTPSNHLFLNLTERSSQEIFRPLEDKFQYLYDLDKKNPSDNCWLSIVHYHVDKITHLYCIMANCVGNNYWNNIAPEYLQKSQINKAISQVVMETLKFISQYHHFYNDQKKAQQYWLKHFDPNDDLSLRCCDLREMEKYLKDPNVNKVNCLMTACSEGFYPIVANIINSEEFINVDFKTVLNALKLAVKNNNFDLLQLFFLSHRFRFLIDNDFTQLLNYISDEYDEKFITLIKHITATSFSTLIPEHLLLKTHEQLLSKCLAAKAKKMEDITSLKLAVGNPLIRKLVEKQDTHSLF
jgi:hypothetical protein